MIEIRPSFVDWVGHIARNCLCIDLQSCGEGGFRTDASAGSPELFARDCLMQPKRVGPVRLIAERIEAENALTFRKKALCVFIDGRAPVLFCCFLLWLLSVHGKKNGRNRGGQKLRCPPEAASNKRTTDMLRYM